MRNVVVSAKVSMDGVMQGPGGPDDGQAAAGRPPLP